MAPRDKTACQTFPCKYKICIFSIESDVYNKKKIQMFVVNMTFISSREVKKCIFHSCLRHSWNIHFFTSLDEIKVIFTPNIWISSIFCMTMPSLILPHQQYNLSTPSSGNCCPPSIQPRHCPLRLLFVSRTDKKRPAGNKYETRAALISIVNRYLSSRSTSSLQREYKSSHEDCKRI